MNNQLCIIHPYFNTIGGSEKIVLSLIQSLKERQVNTNLYTFNVTKDIITDNFFQETRNYDIKEYLTQFCDIEESDNFKINQLPRSMIPINLLKKVFETKKMTVALGKQKSVLITSGNLFLDKIDADHIIIYCNSDFSSELEFIKTKYSGMSKFYYGLIQKHVKKQLEQIQDYKVKLIANSEFTKATIQKQFNKPSTVIYPPIQINPRNDENKQNKLITVSRFSPNKKLDFAFDVMKNISYGWNLIASITSESEHSLYKKLLDENKQYTRKNIYLNINSKSIGSILAQYKVYFHPSPETFGLSVVEAISNGCIPIVPNNSAHLETVPFPELRFNDKQEAIQLINDAINGKFDYLKESLIENLEKFSEKSFMDEMLNVLNFTSVKGTPCPPKFEGGDDLSEGIN